MRAAALHEESLSLARAAGDQAGVARSLMNLGVAARDAGQHERAAHLYAESLDVFRAIGNGWGIAAGLSNLAEVTRHQRHYAPAEALYRESLPLYQQLGHKQGVAECLEGLAWIYGVHGRVEAAARLFGATEALRHAIGAIAVAVDRDKVRYDLAVLASGAADVGRVDVVALITADDFANAWQSGALLAVDEVVAEALADDYRDSVPVDELEQSFDLLISHGDELLARFYELVFAHGPALRRLFERADMHVLKPKFLSTLVTLRQSWRDLDRFVPDLEALGARHRRYGALPEHYALLGNDLVQAMVEIGGPDWKPEYTACWREAFSVVQTVMLRGAAGDQARDVVRRKATSAVPEMQLLG